MILGKIPNYIPSAGRRPVVAKGTLRAEEGLSRLSGATPRTAAAVLNSHGHVLGTRGAARRALVTAT